MVLTGRAALLAAIAVLAVAWSGSPWAIAIATGALALLLGTDLALAPSPAKVVVVREGDRSIRLGATANVSVLVTNTGRRRLRARIRDSWIPSAGAEGGVGSVDVPAGQRRRHDTLLRPVRRGDRKAGPVVLRTFGPLGLAGRQRQHQAPWTVRVLPPFNSRKHLPSRIARLRELDGRSTILQRGQGTEFDSLREYVPGDDVRSIDWRGTARSSTVVVKTWRPERDRHVLIVLDSGRTSAGRVGDQPKLDHHMDAALLLAALASRAGDRVDLLIVDRQLRGSVMRASASELLSAMVNEMANVEPVLGETHHRTMVAEILARVSQRSLVVILTGLDSAAIFDGLIPVLAPVRRKHRVVIGAVSDPRLDELTGRAGEIGDAYEAAAAEAERTRLAETTDSLGRIGLTVVSSAPERFAPDLADHYLALKKAGKL